MAKYVPGGYGPGKYGKKKPAPNPEALREFHAGESLGKLVNSLQGERIASTDHIQRKKLSRNEKEELTLAALENIEALQIPKSPYFGKKVDRKSEFGIPDCLKQAAEIIKRNGHDIYKVIDHVLYAGALKSIAPLGTVLRLFPASSEKSRIEYRRAVISLFKELGRPEEHTEMELLGIKGEAQDFAVKLYELDRSRWFPKAEYPFLVKKGRMLLIDPPLTLAQSVPFITGDKRMVIVSDNYWATEIFSSLARLPGHRKNIPNVQTHGFHISRVLDKLSTGEYSLIHIFGTEGAGSAIKFRSVSELAPQLKEGGKIIVEFNSFPAERAIAANATQSTIYANWIRKFKLQFEMKLGRTAYVTSKSELEKVFHPMDISQKDYLIFTKNGAVDAEREIDKLKKNILALDGLGRLKEGHLFEEWKKTVRGFRISTIADKKSELLDAFRDQINIIRGAADMKYIALATKSLKNRNYEDFVQNYFMATEPSRK
jgi:hypothetical protein